MPPGSPTAVGSHDGPRGLIAVSIENHDDFVLICECLEKKGYQVIRVTPAPDLPTALTIDLPDLVILDHIEALKHLREFEAFLGVSVIFFTPWHDRRLLTVDDQRQHWQHLADLADLAELAAAASSRSLFNSFCEKILQGKKIGETIKIKITFNGNTNRLSFVVTK